MAGRDPRPLRSRTAMVPDPVLPSTPRRLGFGLGVAWVAMSTSAVVIVLAQPIPPLTVAAARVAITAVAWLLVVAWTASRRARGAREVARGSATPRLPRGRILLSGVLLGIHFALWIGSLSLTSVPHAAVLVALQPLFAGLLGLFVGDRASWRLFLGVAVALLGTALMTSTDTGEFNPLGDLLAVLAAACAAAYLVVNRGVRDDVRLSSLLWRVNGIAALTILVGIPLLGQPIWSEAAGLGNGLAVLWLGLLPGFVGHGVMNWAARSLAVHVVSLAVLLEPVGAALLAWFLLGQTVGGIEVLGAGLLLLGAGLTLWKR